MQLNELAPALLAIGDLCHEANRVANGDRSRIHVRIHTDIHQGCFQIDLELVQTLVEQAKSLLFAGSAAGAADLLVLLGFGKGKLPGLFDVIKWLQGELKPATARTEDGTVIQLTNSHGNTIEVHNHVVQLLDSRKAIEASYRTILPLERTGVDRFEIRQDNVPVQTVASEETPSFEERATAQEADVLLTNRTEAIVGLARPAFDAKLQWTVTDGSRRYPVKIEDKTFLGQVERREHTFGVNDALRVRMRITTHRKPAGGIRTEHTVEKVLAIIPGAEGRQITLFDRDED